MALSNGLAANTYVDNTAVNSTACYYVVAATDGSSNESEYSSEVSATSGVVLTGYAQWAADHGVETATNDFDADGIWVVRSAAVRALEV